MSITQLYFTCGCGEFSTDLTDLGNNSQLKTITFDTLLARAATHCEQKGHVLQITGTIKPSDIRLLTKKQEDLAKKQIHTIPEPRPAHRKDLPKNGRVIIVHPADGRPPIIQYIHDGATFTPVTMPLDSAESHPELYPVPGVPYLKEGSIVDTPSVVEQVTERTKEIKEIDNSFAALRARLKKKD